VSGHLVVVGGGISGLSAAWEATRAGWDVTVLESSDRTGGKIRTTPFAGRLVDEGADTFLRRVPDALDLCREIGLDDLTEPTTGSASIWSEGALHPIPGGTVLGVPVEVAPLAESGLVSQRTLSLVEAEAERRGDPIEGDVALGPYLRDHFGDEVVDRLVSPLVGGIYAGTIDEMSLDASTPQLADAAHRDASLRRALSAREAPAAGPVFAAPREGMSTLTSRLGDALVDAGAQIRLNAPVDALDRSGAEWTVSAGVDVSAAAVVLAVPPAIAAGLLGPSHPQSAKEIDAIGSASVVLVTLAYELADLPGELVGSGFLVPRTERELRITAVSWFTSKWASLARDDGLAILRVSLGHAADASAIDLSDDEVLGTVSRDLHRTMGIDAAPVESRISRWRDGFPQFGVGHLERIASVEAALAAATPSLGLAGAMMQGVGIPACIRQGRAAARRLSIR
jgi:oxygen-dependent protoporphyrinogen oxidase